MTARTRGVLARRASVARRWLIRPLSTHLLWGYMRRHACAASVAAPHRMSCLARRVSAAGPAQRQTRTSVTWARPIRDAPTSTAASSRRAQRRRPAAPAKLLRARSVRPAATPGLAPEWRLHPCSIYILLTTVTIPDDAILALYLIDLCVPRARVSGSKMASSSIRRPESFVGSSAGPSIQIQIQVQVRRRRR